MKAVLASGAKLAVAGPEILGEGPVGLPGRFFNKTSMLDDYRVLTRVVAEANSVPYIDMRAAFLNAIPFWWLLPSGVVTVDGEHPNDTGTGIEAQLFAATINAWLYSR